MDAKSAETIRNLAAHLPARAGSASRAASPADANLPESGELCPVCNGSGWTADTSSLERRVRRCDCFHSRRARILLQGAQIPRRYESAGFDNFSTSGEQEVLRPLHMKISAYAREYPLSRHGLLFVGASGCGKTHLTVACVRELVAKGISCLFCDFSELLKRIQNSYSSSVQVTELDILRPVFECEVLALDDFGASRPTDWVLESVGTILQSRYNENRPVIITTNYPDGPSSYFQKMSSVERAVRDETLGDRIGDRMLSRIHQMCRILQFPASAPDYRSRNARLA